MKEGSTDLETTLAADDRRMVAVQEAGHAVMLTVHGIPVEYATVFPGGHVCSVTGHKPGGQVKHQLVYPGGGILPYINDQAMALRCALREIRIMVAGMLAELIALQAPLADQIAGGSCVDWNNAQAIAADFHANERDQVALVGQGCRGCIKILKEPPVWAAVLDLAGHLEGFGLADSDSVKEIVSRRHVRHGLKIRL